MHPPAGPDQLQIILFIPRWTEAVHCLGSLIRQFPALRAIALAADEDEARRARRAWPPEGSPLLLLHDSSAASHNKAVEAVIEMVKMRGPEGVAVLLLDGPELSGYREQARGAWSRAFCRLLGREILDLQVLEYASSWAESPPRPR